MKKIGIFALAAIMVMGLALSAQATTILTPWAPNGPQGTSEVNLYAIVSGWTGETILNVDLEGAANLGTLGAGCYDLLEYATYAGYSQTLTVPTDNHLAITPPSKFNSADVAFAPIQFTQASSFAFTDGSNSFTSLLATDGSGALDRLPGLIIDLGVINPALTGQYLVAFEDGDASNFSNGVFHGDQDYNDMVGLVRECPVPVPPSVLLMGSGLLGLGLVGWRRRFFG